MEILGIDIGGSGIKGAIVNTSNGQFVSDRISLPTPNPATPDLIASEVNFMVKIFNWQGPVGCCFPTVVINGKSQTKGNISSEWIGVQIDNLFTKACNGLSFFVANDADLASIAEMNLGAGKGKKGKVMLITIGTGLGTGVFYDGQLIPNVELGRIFNSDGKIFELFAAGSAKTKDDLSLKEWAERFDFYLNHIKRIFAPDNFIIGGGLSEKFDDFKAYLTVDVPIETAHFKNDAGIIGAAIYAQLEMTKG